MLLGYLGGWDWGWEGEAQLRLLCVLCSRLDMIEYLAPSSGLLIVDH